MWTENSLNGWALSGDQWEQSWQSIIRSEPQESALSLILFNIFTNVSDDGTKCTPSSLLVT